MTDTAAQRITLYKRSKSPPEEGGIFDKRKIIPDVVAEATTDMFFDVFHHQLR